MYSKNAPSLQSRFLGAWWGIFIGDALGLYSDGYYNLERLRADYPEAPGYIAPHALHPYNATHQKTVPPLPEEYDFMQGRRERWARSGTHLHFGLSAGDNSLPAVLALDLATLLSQKTAYRRENWLPIYRHRLTAPGANNDFYIPGAHRDFFIRLAAGLDVDHAGKSETHVCGVIEALPILLRRAGDADRTLRELRDHILLTRPCPALVHAAGILGEALPHLLAGVTLDDTLFHKLGHNHDAYLGYPYHRWIAARSDIDVATHELGTGPLIDDALPLALFLALKYHADFEKALTVNARLGGDAPSRGAIIGMLLGAVHGCEGIRSGLVGGLVRREALDAAGDGLWNAFHGAEKTVAAR